MKPHALDLIPYEDIVIFCAIEKIVTALPNVTLGNRADGRKVPIFCHVLTRAIASIFPTLRVCDGVLPMNYEHSWLLTKNECIIDPYPIAAVGGPIIFDNTPLWRSFYGPEICFIAHREEPFTSWVEALTRIVHEVYFNKILH